MHLYIVANNWHLRNDFSWVYQKIFPNRFQIILTLMLTLVLQMSASKLQEGFVILLRFLIIYNYCAALLAQLLSITL